MKLRTMTEERIKNHPYIKIEKTSVRPLDNNFNTRGGWVAKYYSFNEVVELYDHELHLEGSVDEFYYVDESETNTVFSKTIEEYL